MKTRDGKTIKLIRPTPDEQLHLWSDAFRRLLNVVEPFQDKEQEHAVYKIATDLNNALFGEYRVRD